MLDQNESCIKSILPNACRISPYTGWYCNQTQTQTPSCTVISKVENGTIIDKNKPLYPYNWGSGSIGSETVECVGTNLLRIGDNTYTGIPK